MKIWVKVNPLSKKMTRPGFSRHIRYLRDLLKGEHFEIGEYTYAFETPAIYTHPGRKLRIGKFCSIGAKVTVLLGGNHRIKAVSTYPFAAFCDNWPEASSFIDSDIEEGSKGDVIIGNDVWIGYGALILSGVRIGDGAVIGAGTLVTADIEPYSIVIGNPAHLIKKRFDDQTILKLLEIKWWDWPVEKIRQNISVINSEDISKLFLVWQTVSNYSNKGKT